MGFSKELQKAFEENNRREVERKFNHHINSTNVDALGGVANRSIGQFATPQTPLADLSTEIRKLQEHFAELARQIKTLSETLYPRLEALEMKVGN